MADPQPVLRICVRKSELPPEECAVPERCENRQCQACGQDVHYDPKASIPVLGKEMIVCITCLEKAIDRKTG